MELTSAQRRLLKQQAHHLKPLAYVGKEGISPAFVKEVSQTLTDHELVKVKFNSFKEEKDDLVETLRLRTQSTLVAMVGNVAILFRQHKDKKKRKIKLAKPVLPVG